MNAVHPCPQAWFETNVSTVVEFVTSIKAEIDAGKRHILVKAPVKSGKRVMVEALAVFLPKCRVKYVTSLNRKDVKAQKSELEKYGVKTHLMSDATKVVEATADIRFDIAGRYDVVCCYDECDYGSGTKQIMGPFYESFLDDTNVIKIYFSATAHETATSNVSARYDYVALTYVPPPSYCGAAYFLREGLVFDPQSFFEDDDGEIVVTGHGIQVIRDSITADRHIAVVRTTRSIPTATFKTDAVKAGIASQLGAAMEDGKVWDIRVIDDKSPFNWEDEETRDGFVVNRRKNYLFVILQTCTRGTDLKGWHHKLAFWHDKRGSEAVNLNTMIQATLRPCHYSTNYEGVPQRVRLYVDRRVVQMAADDDMDAYIAAGGKAPARTKCVSPSRQALGWSKPIAIHIPEHLREHENIIGYLTPARRAWWTTILDSLLSPSQRATLAGRTLKNKRSYDSDEIVGGIFSVHKAFTENRASRPGGGVTAELEAVRQEHFWLDIATEDLEGMVAGTAYITYGTVERSAELLRTTPASMYESRRGDI